MLLTESDDVLTPPADYHCHRLKVGLAEGVDEIPVGGCFPLEYNLDYLNGGEHTI